MNTFSYPAFGRVFLSVVKALNRQANSLSDVAVISENVWSEDGGAEEQKKSPRCAGKNPCYFLG
ncbi:hypothetical protein EB241_06145 [Erwinia psidii]|uniref:Uncharacterized protein n=1 Tax=Erwinia psidii TaxID=69224 RepID=A0A3N6S3A0_9GAMM|nr:hypothetical protein EB241_06145 [Erwinia psidii]